MKDQEESRVLSLGHQEDSSLVDIIAAGAAMPVVRRKEVLEHLLLPRLSKTHRDVRVSIQKATLRVLGVTCHQVSQKISGNFKDNSWFAEVVLIFLFFVLEHLPRNQNFSFLIISMTIIC